MEIPGLKKEDLTIYRQNITTIVKGCKNKPYEGKDLVVEKNERKYGDFTMTFKIPELYERKW
jgi:HSP20 family molecular chaperone IbpA